MKLYEHIDDLLTESPESLGFPRLVAGQIRREVHHRKAQDYVAQWFKDLEDVGANRRKMEKFFTSVTKKIGEDDIFRLAKSMGILYRMRGDDPGTDDVRSAIIKDLSNARSVDEFLTIRKKIAKSVEVKKVRLIALHSVDRVLSRFLRDRVFYIYPDLIEFLNSDENAYRKLKGLDLIRANERALEEIEDDLFDESRIELTLQDGYYWYRIEGEKECALEGDRMQHCGSIDSRTSKMYSLRDEGNKSHMTVEFNGRDKELPQVRGKQNRTPVKKYWRYLPDLITKVIRKKVFFTDFDAEDSNQPIAKEFREFVGNVKNVQVIKVGSISGTDELR